MFAAAMASETAFILFGCALFAAALFVYIFYRAGRRRAGRGQDALGYLDERKEATYENLRDLNFEYKAGKLSEEDYAMQRAALEDEAAAILAEMEASRSARRGRWRQGRAGRENEILSLMLLALADAPIASSPSPLAQNITGTVTNGTTGKPAAGDDVTLLSLSQGMQEIGSTKSDAQGKFSLPAPADQAPHMVRVTHGGVNYFPARRAADAGRDHRRGHRVRHGEES